MKPTQEQIIAWARDSGMELYGLGKDRAKFVYYLEAFATLAYEAGRKDENEAIAQLFEGAPKFVPAAMNTHGGCLLCGFVPAIAVEVIRERLKS